MIFALLIALGCSDADPDAPVCRAGTTLEADGHCYPPMPSFPPSVRDAVEALPACEPAGGIGEIDVARGCAGGACAGMRYVEWVDALGDSATCATASHDARFVYCTWAELGVDGLWRDEDQDRSPDPAARTDRIHLFGPHVGATPEGAGIGSNLACLVDELGLPDRMNVVNVAGQLMIRELVWDGFGVFAYDLGDDDRSGLPNGYLDRLYLYGM